MGRSIGKMRVQVLPDMPVVPTENVGIMSGPIRKPRRQGRRMRPKGSVRPSPRIGQRPLRRGEQEFAERLRRDREAGITRTPQEESKLMWVIDPHEYENPYYTYSYKQSDK